MYPDSTEEGGPLPERPPSPGWALPPGARPAPEGPWADRDDQDMNGYDVAVRDAARCACGCSRLVHSDGGACMLCARCASFRPRWRERAATAIARSRETVAALLGR